MRNCVLSVDEGIEVDVEKAISKLGSNGLDVLLLIQSSSGEVLGALGGFAGMRQLVSGIWPWWWPHPRNFS